MGFALEVNGALVITTPGVPVELTAMLPEICDRIATRIGGGTAFIRRLQTFGIGESTIQELVNARTDDWPNGVTLGFRSGLPPARTRYRSMMPASLITETTLRIYSTNSLAITLSGADDEQSHVFATSTAQSKNVGDSSRVLHRRLDCVADHA